MSNVARPHPCRTTVLDLNPPSRRLALRITEKIHAMVQSLDCDICIDIGNGEGVVEYMETIRATRYYLAGLTLSEHATVRVDDSETGRVRGTMECYDEWKQ